jgi:hypothetical protein
VAKKIQILLLVMIREHQHKLVMLHAVRTNWKKGGQETSSFRFGD